MNRPTRTPLSDSVAFAAIALAGTAHAAILQGVYSASGSHPGVRIDWSSDFGVDPVDSAWTDGYVVHTGFHDAFVEGWGPGHATSYFSVNCPAPQATPGLPIVLHSEIDVQNWSDVYGLSGSASAGEMYLQLDQSYPTLYYYVEWSYSYENIVPFNGAGAVGFRAGPTYVPAHAGGTYAPGVFSGSFDGTTSGSAMHFTMGSDLYQGQGAHGHGRLVSDMRIWVDSNPIPGPGAVGLGAAGLALVARRRKRR